jgi:LmbE family N-acetylglucosaminyl deacetylase
MARLDISLIGHIVTTLSFIGVAIYASVRQKVLHRTTRNSTAIFIIIIVISLMFAAVNIFRFIYEIAGGQEITLTSDIDLAAQYSGIFVQSAFILILFGNKIIVQPKMTAARVLAIGAHPDDIEIAAGAALSKMRDMGYQIFGVVMTTGEKGGDATIRPTEARRGAEFLGLDVVEVLNFSDTRLAAEAFEITQSIENMIEKYQPEIIFTHSVHDLHQDHQTVYEATLRAARNTRTTILCYESPSVTQEFHPTYFVDVGKYVDVKIRAMREHGNQKTKPYMKPDLVRGKLAFRGAQAKVDYAEAFEVARMVSAI